GGVELSEDSSVETGGSRRASPRSGKGGRKGCEKIPKGKQKISESKDVKTKPAVNYIFTAVLFFVLIWKLFYKWRALNDRFDRLIPDRNKQFRSFFRKSSVDVS